MQNIKSIINAHNRKIIYETNVLNQQEKCNCINKPECPLNNECQTTNIVYKAKSTSNLENYKEKVYIGSEEKFKLRFNHKKSLMHHKHQKETELSNELWKLSNFFYILYILSIYQPHHLGNYMILLEYKGDNLLNLERVNF